MARKIPIKYILTVNNSFSQKELFLLDDYSSYARTYTVNGNLVTINGLIKWTRDKLVNELPIAILPPEARPRSRKVFNVSCHEYCGRVDILPSGLIMFMSVSEQAVVKTRNYRWVCLDGIEFATGDDIEIPLTPGYKAFSSQVVNLEILV